MLLRVVARAVSTSACLNVGREQVGGVVKAGSRLWGSGVLALAGMMPQGSLRLREQEDEAVQLPFPCQALHMH